MALTPEDVVKREFTKPKGFGRSGYDEIQVDDFLDEIVVELRRLNAENEDLTGKLEDCRRSKGQPGRETAGSGTSTEGASGVPALTPVRADADKDTDKTEAIPAVAAKAGNGTAAGSSEADQAALTKAREELASAQRELATVRGERDKVQADIDRAQQRLTELEQQIEKAEREATERTEAANTRAETAERDAASRESAAGDRQGAAPAGLGQVGAPGAASGAVPGNDSAAGVIALAQRLHDEHVREGETTRDRLVSEAQEQHDSLIGEGTSKRDELIASGQSKHDELVGTAQTRHDELMRQANERSTGLVKEAEDRRDRIIGQLTTEREGISGKIEELRAFEGEYRTKLKGFIQGQLSDLEHQGAATGGEHHG